MKHIKEFIHKISGPVIFQLSVIVCILVSLAYTNYKVRVSQKQYVTVATNAISQRFLASVIRADLPDSTYKNLLSKFDKTLTKIVNNVSAKNNFIILKQNTVLTTLPDITIEIEKLIWKDMGLDKLLLSQNKK